MRTGNMEVVALATECKSLAERKHDWILPAAKIDYIWHGPNNDFLEFQNGRGLMEARPTRTCQEQLATYLGIPIKYFDRCRSQQEDVLSDQVNWWLTQDPKARRIRGLMPKEESGEILARAFVSDRFQPFDSDDVVTTVLPVMMNQQCVVKDAFVDIEQLHFTVTNDKLVGEIKVGDPVRGGISLRNSDVGQGILEMATFIEVLRCKNGAVIRQNMEGMTRKHFGGRNEYGEDGEIFQDDTKRAQKETFWKEARDIVSAMLKPERFAAMCERLRESSMRQLNPAANFLHAMDVVENTYGLSHEEKDNVFEALIRGQDTTIYGMANAVTFTAHGADYLRGAQLEEIGGQIMSNPPKELLN